MIESQDKNAFLEYLAATNNTICGRHPITLFLSLLESLPASARSSTEIRFLRYAQSSAAQNTSDSSVSYASALIKVASDAK